MDMNSKTAPSPGPSSKGAAAQPASAARRFNTLLIVGVAEACDEIAIAHPLAFVEQR